MTVVFRSLMALFVVTMSANVSAESLTLFRGQGADTNFLELLSDIANDELTMDPTYFWGVNYRNTLSNKGENGFTRFLLRYQITPEWEAQLTKHSGLQNNAAVHMAVLLRTRDFRPAIFNINFAAGLGPSYAFSRPTYEDGPDGQPNQGKYRFQNYMAYEVEFSLRSLPQWRVPVRIHHRSGMYGLIAPRRVGSNFFAIGLRREF
ncbi:MAG: hypothetical protein GXP17_03930 [Gammaproteobacteria bacterium]|nr:hypothetical protein [Gammaproteobacteria bacterium]